jgi:hypothetical protein
LGGEELLMRASVTGSITARRNGNRLSSGLSPAVQCKFYRFGSQFPFFADILCITFAETFVLAFSLHHIVRLSAETSHARPLYPRKRTSPKPVAMSARCQKAASPFHLAFGFAYRVRADATAQGPRADGLHAHPFPLWGSTEMKAQNRINARHFILGRAYYRDDYYARILFPMGRN